MGRLGLVEGKVWARYLAPVVFLLAVTGVVLAVRAGLRSNGGSETTTVATAAGARTAPAERPKPKPARRYYVIRPGDTLGAIAAQAGTSVAALLRLNPGVQPTTLRPGERLRVR